MELLFSVQNQHIERIDSMYPVADSIDYLTARFSFSTSDWEGLTKTAIFRNGDEVFNVILDTNNECIVPWEVVKRGKLSVSLFAGNRITTDKCIVDIVASGYEPAPTPEEPTPTAYEQMVEILDNLKGGNAGKYLVKSTGNDYDFAWANGGGGGGTTYWGDILGLITDQDDLQDALESKAIASNVYTKTEADGKFNPTNNFKTVNGVSIIGTGDIPVSGGGSASWGGIGGTLSNQTDLQNALNAKANASSVYTKTETDNALALKANASNVYTKTETYTKTEVNNAISTAIGGALNGSY